MTDDAQLLRRYLEEGSELAFRELVDRQIHLVYSAARRIVAGDAHLAQDITQTVFADLARKAVSLSRVKVLSGWLYRHTCFTAWKAVRLERRRHAREREAVGMNSVNDNPASDIVWRQLEPLLDEAISRLDTRDRDAVVLRFFERRDFRSVGLALDLSEDAAQKRVARALDKLRAYLTHRGVTLSSAALATALTGSAVQSAPAALAGTISAAVITGAAAATAGSTFNLLNLMSMTKLKAGLLSAAIALGAGTPIVVQQQSLSRLRAENQLLREQSRQLEQLRVEKRQLAGLRAEADELERLRKEVAELHRLRAEVALFRREREDEARLQAENTRSNEHLNPSEADEPRSQRDLRNACENHLRIVEGAKDQAALENRLGIGSDVTAEQLAPFLKDGFESIQCPSVGQYTIGKIGEVARCSVHGALTASSAETDAYEKQAIDRGNYAMQWMRAFLDFAHDHEGRFPATFAQASAQDPHELLKSTDPADLSTERKPPDGLRTIERVNTSDLFEIMYTGNVNTLKEPNRVIVIREKQPWHDAHGRLVKVYGFADGHTEIHRVPVLGNFEQWESERMVRSAGQ